MFEQALEQARKRGVYFFVNKDEWTLHLSICLAQGLKELGVPVYAGLDAANGLFKRDDVLPVATQYSVIDLSAIEGGEDLFQTMLPYVLSLKHRTAALCVADNVNMTVFPKELLVFACHANPGFKPRDRRLPLGIGLSRHMIDEAAKHGGHPRQRAILKNFRPSWSQTVRQALDLSLIPILAGRFALDPKTDEGWRFTPSFYERLSRALGCLAYGGFLAQGNADIADAIDDGRTIIGRWDSYRFWESLAAGCATITLDLDAYNFQLPVMPVNRKHYVGLRLDTLVDDVEFLATTDRLEEIGEAGRRWVLEHYSPIATARRFIAKMDELYPTSS